MQQIIRYVKDTPTRDFARLIDHTILKPEATLDSIVKTVEEAVEHGFATAVVPPWSVRRLVEMGLGRRARLCTVVGFPHGNAPTEVKVKEAELAIEWGISELDMVINVSAVKSGDWEYARRDVESVVEVAHDSEVQVKVIIECGLLSDEEIVKASKVVVEAGGDYVKTSTGFGPRGATVHDVLLISSAVNGRAKVKAAGGIRHAEDAVAMVLAGASRIGTSSGVKIIREYEELRRRLVGVP